MEYLSSLLCQATRLAAEAHDGARRKGTRMPHIMHAMETAAIVGTMTEDEDVLAAAVLHDVLQDTGVTEEQLRETVGSHVTELVLAVNEDKHKGEDPVETWRVRKQECVDKLLAEHRLEVKMIVLGAQLSSLRSIYREYMVEGERVWERFHNKNRAEQGWYYQAVTDALQDLNDYPVWHELANLVWEVFWQERDIDQLRFDFSPNELRELESI